MFLPLLCQTFGDRECLCPTHPMEPSGLKYLICTSRAVFIRANTHRERFVFFCGKFANAESTSKYNISLLVFLKVSIQQVFHISLNLTKKNALSTTGIRNVHMDGWSELSS